MNSQGTRHQHPPERTTIASKDLSQPEVFGRAKILLACWNCGHEMWVDTSNTHVFCPNCGEWLDRTNGLMDRI